MYCTILQTLYKPSSTEHNRLSLPFMLPWYAMIKWVSNLWTLYNRWKVQIYVVQYTATCPLVCLWDYQISIQEKKYLHDLHQRVASKMFYILKKYDFNYLEIIDMMIF